TPANAATCAARPTRMGETNEWSIRGATRERRKRGARSMANLAHRARDVRGAQREAGLARGRIRESDGRARARVGVRVRVRERCREPPARLHRTGGGGGFLPFPFPKEVNGRERERERERSVERSRPQFSRSCPAPVRALSTKGAARTS